MFPKTALLVALVLSPLQAAQGKNRPQFSCKALLIATTVAGALLAGWREVQVGRALQTSAFIGHSQYRSPYNLFSLDEESRSAVVHYQAIGLLESPQAHAILLRHRNHQEYGPQIQELDLPEDVSVFMERLGNNFSRGQSRSCDDSPWAWPNGFSEGWNPSPWYWTAADRTERWRTQYWRVGHNRKVIEYRARAATVLESILTDALEDVLASGEI